MWISWRLERLQPEMEYLGAVPLLLLAIFFTHLHVGAVNPHTGGAKSSFSSAWHSTAAGSSTWSWLSQMADMDGAEFGHAATPMLQMCRNVQYYQEDKSTVPPIQGWALSSRMEPLVVGKTGTRVLALVYEEEQDGEEVAAVPPRAVVAFRGRMDGDGDHLLSSVFDRTSVNATELHFNMYSFAACNLAFDYAEALAYTLETLQQYPPSSVLITGNSMGACLAVLATATIWTHNAMAIATMVFQDPGVRSGIIMRSLSLQGYDATVVGIGNEWDPVIRLNWDGHVGTLCLLSPEWPEPPYSCVRCYAGESEEGEDCRSCKASNHDSSLLLERFAQGQAPTCYSMGYDVATIHSS